MDNISMQSKESNMEDENHGWQVSRPKKVRKTRKIQVIGETRTSSRIPRDGVPISLKATNRAKERDNTSGTNSHNSFVVLNSTSSTVL